MVSSCPFRVQVPVCNILLNSGVGRRCINGNIFPVLESYDYFFVLVSGAFNHTLSLELGFSSPKTSTMIGFATVLTLSMD